MSNRLEPDLQTAASAAIPDPAEFGPFYKILREDLTHNGFTYQAGLNVDTEPFEPQERCYGGLYFSDLEHIAQYFAYGDWVARVTLPPNARWIQEDADKFKADRVILSDLQPWKDWDLWNDDTFIKHAVQQDGCVLQHAKHQTPELCLAAVQQNGLALQYVKRQTPTLCLAAVQEDGLALQYVKHQTYDICLTAGQENVQSLKYVKYRTHELNRAIWLYHRSECCGDSEDSCEDSCEDSDSCEEKKYKK